MSWIISVFAMLVLTSLSGTIAFLVWKVWAAYMERRKKLQWVYPMLAIVELFFVCQLAYSIVMLWRDAGARTYAERGYLFMHTWVISIACIVLLLVWVGFAVRRLVVYVRGTNAMKDALDCSIVPAEPELTELADEIRGRLGVRQRVLVCRSDLVETPVVMNGIQKRIIFPMWEYDRKEIEVILCHELTHVKQKVLPLKVVGIALRFVYWFNPLVHVFMRELDEWGETACDIAVRYDAGCVENFREYFDVVLSGVEKRMQASDEWTQLRKTKGVVLRVNRIRDYKRENDWHIVGGIVAMLVFCLTCTTTVAAAGIEISKQYVKIYNGTVNEVEEANDAGDGLVEFEEEWDPSDESIVLAPVTVQPLASGLVGWDLPAYEAYHGPGFYVSGSGIITVGVTCTPAGNWFKAGILTPDGKKRYVRSTYNVNHSFDVTAKGTYYVFVENESGVMLEVAGHYVY